MTTGRINQVANPSATRPGGLGPRATAAAPRACFFPAGPQRSASAPTLTRGLGQGGSKLGRAGGRRRRFVPAHGPCVSLRPRLRGVEEAESGRRGGARGPGSRRTPLGALSSVRAYSGRDRGLSPFGDSAWTWAAALQLPGAGRFDALGIEFPAGTESVR